MVPRQDTPAGDKLQSWKEIAAYLRVTVRTAQRWEKVVGLPVHRLGSGKGAHIFAYTGELERWLAEAAPREAVPVAPTPSGRRLRVAAVAMALVVATCLPVAWRTGWLPWARQPHAWSANGHKLTVVDERDRLCWERHFPEFETNIPPGIRNRAVVADIDGDGSREVLFHYFPKDPSRDRGALFCFDRRGRLRWKHLLGAPRSFGARTFDTNYRGWIVQPVQIGGRHLVLSIANHHLWHPSRAALLDARTGELVEEYWHPGSIYWCLLRDLDGDGEPEALFAAINNPGEGLGRPALGVLKLPFSRTPRPQPPADTPLPPVTGGGEAAYLLFPASDVSRAAGSLPYPAYLSIDEHRRIHLEVAQPEHSGIVYTLDFGLRVIEHRYSDNFAPLHERLRKTGLLDHAWSPAESARLAQPHRFAWAVDGNSPELDRRERVR